MRAVRGCLARIGCLTVLALIAAGAWMWRGPLLAWWHERGRPPAMGAPSAELARRSGRKLDDFLRGKGPSRVSFDQAELQSLLRYRYRDSLPPGLSDPRVSLGDSTLEASAGLQVQRLMDGKAPDALRSLLGDSARASAELEPSVPRPGLLTLGVRHVSAGGLPIPDLMVPWLLRQVGLSNGGGPGRSVALRVPLDVAAVRVVKGRLELVRAPPD